MTTLTIDISEERWQRLQALADRYGIAVSDLVRAGIERLLSDLNEDFDKEVEFILRENEELYRRLA